MRVLPILGQHMTDDSVRKCLGLLAVSLPGLILCIAKFIDESKCCCS